jgi:hypothetical protein
MLCIKPTVLCSNHALHQNRVGVQAAAHGAIYVLQHLMRLKLESEGQAPRGCIVVAEAGAGEGRGAGAFTDEGHVASPPPRRLRQALLYLVRQLLQTPGRSVCVAHCAWPQYLV